MTQEKITSMWQLIIILLLLPLILVYLLYWKLKIRYYYDVRLWFIRSPYRARYCVHWIRHTWRLANLRLKIVGLLLIRLFHMR